MKGISNYFDKIKSIAFREVERRVFVSETINKEIGFEVGIENIAIRNGVVYIKAPASIKSQIFIKKEGLIKKISKKIKITDVT